MNPEHDRWVTPRELLDEDFARFQAFKYDAKREEMLQSRGAMNEAAGRALMNEMSFEGKKPVLSQGHVSLSHCHGAVLAGYSSTLELGIDIETERSTLERIAHKFTTDQELEQFTCSRQEALQCIWGIKESLFKLYGFGNVDFKEHLEICSFEWSPESQRGWGVAWIHATCERREEPIACFIQSARIGEYYVSIATHRPPMAAFSTTRLSLREWNLNDAPWLLSLNEDPEVIKFTGDAGFSDAKQALNLIKTYPNYQRDGYGRWMVELRETKEPIGWCGLKNNPWGIDLGFRFFRSHWGNGFATESAQATVQQAKHLGLRRLVGRAMSGNVASIKVLEKVQMKLLEEVPIEEFAKDHGVTDQNANLWKGQSVRVYTLAL